MYFSEEKLRFFKGAVIVGSLNRSNILVSEFVDLSNKNKSLKINYYTVIIIKYKGYRDVYGV